MPEEMTKRTQERKSHGECLSLSEKSVLFVKEESGAIQIMRLRYRFAKEGDIGEELL